MSRYCTKFVTGGGFRDIKIYIGGRQKYKCLLSAIKWHALQFYSDMACVNKGVGAVNPRFCILILSKFILFIAKSLYWT